jgi:tetratricopeptide (TPR) repeat protein
VIRYPQLLLAVALVLALVAPPAAAKRAKKTKKKANAAETEVLAETPSADSLGAAGQAAYEAGDLETAFTAVQQALSIDPDHAAALRIRGRILLDVGIAGQYEGDPRSSEMIFQGLTDLQRSLELEPTGPEAEAVSELLLLLSGNSLFPDPQVDCPEDAEAALSEAEAHFGHGELAEAAEDYERALAGCPDNATWWMYYGDVFFLQEDYTGALLKFERALELEPCHWRAHRFASDTHHRLGDLPRTYRSALLSVACNPTYEKGWDYLGQTLTNYGGTLRRVTVDWPAAPAMGEGGPVITLPQPDDDSDEAAREGALMLVYALARVPIDDETRALSPLEMEQRAVEMGLSFLAEDKAAGEQAPAPSERPMLRAWQLLGAADRDGYLVEAMLMMRLDEALLPEFLAHRETHLDRLLRYTAIHLAPLADDSPIRSDPAAFLEALPELAD